MSVYPVLGDAPSQWSPYEVKLAMALPGKNRHYEMHGIQRRHFNSTAQKVGDASTAEPLIEEILARTPVAIAKVQAALPQCLLPRVADAVLGGLSRQQGYSVQWCRKQEKTWSPQYMLTFHRTTSASALDFPGVRGFFRSLGGNSLGGRADDTRSVAILRSGLGGHPGGGLRDGAVDAGADGVGQIRETLRGSAPEGFAVFVGEEEDIFGAFAKGADLGGDDAGTVCVERQGQLMEQARAVLGDHLHNRELTVGGRREVDFSLDREVFQGSRQGTGG